MAMPNIERDSELLEAQAHIWNQTFNFISSASLKCAIQLGIPDIIQNHGQPIPLSNLLAELPINPTKNRCIYRLMRILVHSGFFVQQKVAGNEQEVEYLLTPASQLLTKDHPLSLSPFLLAMLDPIVTNPWHFMSTWFQNEDETPFYTVNGRTLWDQAGQEPVLNKFFNEAMASDARLVASVVINECKGVFEGLNSLVDVGGGTGTVAKAIAEAFPHLKCTVLDLPHVVANLKGTQNLNFLQGNMFEAIPPADAILLKWILHDWSDEDCVKILKRCREAIPSKEKGGKVIIIDMNMMIQEKNKKEDNESIETQLFWDMLMMVTVSGKERNEEEWKKLFLDAGFSDYNITPVLGLRSLIQLYP
ncbi:trans-resveratrol di-O-methyltransferase-like [Cornus florida]|uniref:trans-resveratrol di-O-methyltransferase-like n=1 Tax=Cornus florida TaxID=4283 RepID=UPI002899A5DF|nr:trans-resveratrol di-O-methyltransferase-like [Cornus florida]